MEVKSTPWRNPGSAEPIAGVLSFVNNTVEQTTATIRLKATFQNTDRRLWPGQTINAVLTLGVQPKAVVVPSQAIQSGQSGTYASSSSRTKPLNSGSSPCLAARTAKP